MEMDSEHLGVLDPGSLWCGSPYSYRQQGKNDPRAGKAGRQRQQKAEGRKESMATSSRIRKLWWAPLLGEGHFAQLSSGAWYFCVCVIVSRRSHIITDPVAAAWGGGGRETGGEREGGKCEDFHCQNVITLHSARESDDWVSGASFKGLPCFCELNKAQSLFAYLLYIPANGKSHLVLQLRQKELMLKKPSR